MLGPAILNDTKGLLQINKKIISTKTYIINSLTLSLQLSFNDVSYSGPREPDAPNLSKGRLLAQNKVYILLPSSYVFPALSVGFTIFGEIFVYMTIFSVQPLR